MDEETKKTIKEIVEDVVLSSHTALAKVQSNSLAEIQKLNGHGRIIKALKSDIGSTIAIIGFLATIISPFYVILIRLALIDERIATSNETLVEIISDKKTEAVKVSAMDNRLYVVESKIARMEVLEVREIDYVNRITAIESALKAVGFLKK